MRILFILLFAFSTASAQVPQAPSQVKLTGTRSWIRVIWADGGQNIDGFKLYWSVKKEKPSQPGAVVAAGNSRYYIQDVQEETDYFVWVEAFNASGSSKAATGKVRTIKEWTLDSDEVNNLNVPGSSAVPKGMELYWHDEFNDDLLNRNKWFTTYYSTIDYLHKENYQALIHDTLPEAAYTLNGKWIDLFVNDSLPLKPFSGGKKISSIQTYSWSTNENLLDNSRGGYFEVRVRRGSTGKPKGLNTAFWFDAPGPNLKYYLQEGTTLDGVEGIRAAGQVFEIDMFEYLNAQFVLHGRVDSNGRFLHNLATDIAKDYKPKKHEPGKEWVTFGLLWTPSAIKHYIDGRLIHSYDDKHQIYSPNHFMNVLLGSYGQGGTVNMEVDYIRYYQWPLEGNNELPNGNAELSGQILPWEGSASVSAAAKRNGKAGFVLEPGQTLTQYVYLNHSMNYELEFWHKGTEGLQVKVNNVKVVTGDFEDETVRGFPGKNNNFLKRKLAFKTGPEFGEHMKTVRIHFENTGDSHIYLDDIGVFSNKQLNS